MTVHRGVAEQPVGDFLIGVAPLGECHGGGVEGAVCHPLPGSLECDEQVVRRLPEIEDGKIQQDVRRGLAALKDRLAARGIGQESGKIVPEAALGTEVHGGVEEPARPGRVRGGVGHPVEEHVVDSVQEQEVDLGLQGGEGNLEVFAQPGEGLGGRERPAGRVRGRTCKLDHGRQPGGGLAEHFRLRDVGRGIEVLDIGWRAVGLLAGEAAVTPGPCIPARDVGLVKVAHGLPVVGLYPGHDLGGTGAAEGRQLVP